MNVRLFPLVGLAIVALVPGCFRHHRAEEPSPAPVAGKEQYPYNNPLSTPGARFGALPQVVQNTVRSEAGTGEIIDVRKEAKRGITYYKISFRNPTVYPPLYVGQDGSVLNPDLSVAVQIPQDTSVEVKLNDVPSSARKVIQDKSGAADIVSINQESWGEHTVFVVTYKDEAHNPKLYVLADGSLLIPAAK